MFPDVNTWADNYRRLSTQMFASIYRINRHVVASKAGKYRHIILVI